MHSEGFQFKFRRKEMAFELLFMFLQKRIKMFIFLDVELL